MPVSSNEFLDIQVTIECGFTLKGIRDMIRRYIQMHHTDKYSQYSSIICPVCANSWVFVYKLSGCGFESCCSHLKFRYRSCFEQGVPWVWINSNMRTLHDKNIESDEVQFHMVLIDVLNIAVRFLEYMTGRNPNMSMSQAGIKVID